MKKAPGIRGLFHIRVRESNYKPGSVACRHSSRCVVTHALKQPTRKVWPGRPLSYLVLLTTGYAKQDMSPHPLVSSYLTVSPLPLPAVCFLLRCPKVTLSGRYPASCPIEPGLSSPGHAPRSGGLSGSHAIIILPCLQKRRSFPIVMDKIYIIFKDWKDNSNKFTKFSIMLFPYTHSLKEYLRVYCFKNILNKKH